MATHHARAGTGLDQRQRRGMDHGVAFCGVIGSGEFGPVAFVRGLSNHHAVGADPASTPDGGMHHGMVRRGEVGHGPAWRVFL